ncbi:tellurite resistance TerB family protein [Ferrimonas lipolytica]|uniref:Tellurite resistance TerB family protein n=1 Tax=Ferrimonas lipolytica TaxID=2724191 RepID=A0A6H1UC02_9GAMM|nr:tellurite resistance TerB family protein [Ferrimonas lipolytica]QIZ76110.1 tellurite resistance TerB family protein [Ferrimonas lipolytica]
MDFQGLLNQVLGAQQSTTPNSNSSPAQQPSTTTAGLGSNLSSGLTGLASGAIGGTLMGMLMGSKKGRKMGKGVAKVGGAAALGALALKAFQSYQQSQSSQPTAAQTQPAATTPTSATVAQLQAPDEIASKQILKAMIGAAKADGHVDEQERQKLQAAVQQAGASASVAQFVDAELAKPLDPADVAAGVNSPELAAELYLVSTLMVDDQSFMEKSYLQELARQLNIAPELAQQLELQAANA